MALVQLDGGCSRERRGLEPGSVPPLWGLVCSPATCAGVNLPGRCFVPWASSCRGDTETRISLGPQEARWAGGG